MSAGKLWLLAAALRVDVSAFFDGLEKPGADTLPEPLNPLKLPFPHRLLGRFHVSDGKRIVLVRRESRAASDYGVHGADPDDHGTLSQGYRSPVAGQCRNHGWDHPPVVKIFDPGGPAIWLLSERDLIGDLFGLCD